MIQLLQIIFMCGSKVLFDEVFVQVFFGYKVVFIGSNGCGKLSLFVLLCGELMLDVGDVSVFGDWWIVSVVQEIFVVLCSVIEYVIDGDKVLCNL